MVTVVLPGLCDISDVVVLNCWERKDFTNALPLVVSVSEDGRKWTNVATATQAAPQWRFRLAEKAPPKSKFVRLERKPGAGKQPLEFRQIQVYGKQLY